MTTAAMSDRTPGVLYPVPVPATSVGVSIGVGAVLIGGWAFAETTGVNPAAFDLIDGGPGGGTLIAPITLSPGQSIRDVIPGGFLSVRSTLWLNMLTGSVRGCVWLGDE